MDYNHHQMLVTHYTNLKELAERQLQAAKLAKNEELDDILRQKQMIMDQIDEFQSRHGEQTYQAEVRFRIRKLLLDITTLDEESQQYLNKRKDALQKEFMTQRHENNLNQKYNGYAETDLRGFIDEKS